MLVPGPPRHRHAFISVRDVARACVEAALRDAPAPEGPLEVGGPAILSWQDVADLYAEVLGRRVRVLSTPAPVYATAARFLADVAPVPSRVLSLNLFMASTESPYAHPGGDLVEAATMTTVESFLRAKAALPPDLLPVP